MSEAHESGGASQAPEPIACGSTTRLARVAGLQGAEAVRGEQQAAAGFQHRAALEARERRVRQRDGKKLVRADRGIVAVRPVQDVEQASVLRVPEAREALLHPRSLVL